MVGARCSSPAANFLWCLDAHVPCGLLSVEEPDGFAAVVSGHSRQVIFSHMSESQWGLTQAKLMESHAG